MEYKAKMEVEKVKAEEMERLCKEIIPDIEKDSVLFDEEVKFSDGSVGIIQVISPLSPKEESCWSQLVICDYADKHILQEVGCSDVGESFLGEFHAKVGEDNYTVKVVIK